VATVLGFRSAVAIDAGLKLRDLAELPPPVGRPPRIFFGRKRTENAWVGAEPCVAAILLFTTGSQRPSKKCSHASNSVE